MKPSVLALCFFFLSSLPIAAQTVDDDLWKSSEDQIHDAIAGRDPDFDKKFLLQLSNFPIYATWHLNDSRYSLYMLANSVPRWNPKWVWQPGRRLDDAYGIFVDGIDVDAATNPQKVQALTRLSKDWVAKGNAVNAERDRLEAAWKSYLSNHKGANKETWWTQHATRLSTLMDQYNIAFGHYNSALPANARTVLSLIQRYPLALTHPIDVRLPDSSSSSMSDNSDTWPIVSQLPFIGSDDMLRRVTTDGEAAVGHPELQTGWTIERGHQHHAEDHTRWGGNVSWGGFFNVGGGGGDDHVTDQKHKFKIAFTALTIGYIPVAPSTSWYSQFLVENFACGPFKSDIAFNPNDLWKDDGSLSLVPSAVLVAYKPTVVITLSDEDYTKVASHIGGSGGISIGPISISGGGSSVHTTEDANQNTKTITVAVTSETPMIMGVLSTRLNPGKVCDKYPH